MKWCCYILFLLCCVPMGIAAQGNSDNPFEIKGATDASSTNTSIQLPPRPDNPFEIAAPAPVQDSASVQADGPLVIRRQTDPDFLDARGRTLGIHILLLVFLALCWIFFRPLLAKIYRASLNEGLFNQLYTERKNGRLGLFLPNYLLYFASLAFFAYLVGQAYEWLPSDRPWQYWRNFLIAITAYYVGKHLVLWLIGEIFPVRSAISQYSFTIMQFGIMLGFLLVPANLLISYAPAGTTKTIVFLSLIIVALLYLLRLGRSLLLVNKFLPQSLLHFLLYICAVEIAPMLILYRMVMG